MQSHEDDPMLGKGTPTAHGRGTNKESEQKTADIRDDYPRKRQNGGQYFGFLLFLFLLQFSCCFETKSQDAAQEQLRPPFVWLPRAGT